MTDAGEVRLLDQPAVLGPDHEVTIRVAVGFEAMDGFGSRHHNLMFEGISVGALATRAALNHGYQPRGITDARRLYDEDRYVVTMAATSGVNNE